MNLRKPLKVVTNVAYTLGVVFTLYFGTISLFGSNESIYPAAMIPITWKERAFIGLAFYKDPIVVDENYENLFWYYEFFTFFLIILAVFWYLYFLKNRWLDLLVCTLVLFYSSFSFRFYKKIKFKKLNSLKVRYLNLHKKTIILISLIIILFF